jgi:hypothetical protein
MLTINQSKKLIIEKLLTSDDFQVFSHLTENLTEENFIIDESIPLISYNNKNKSFYIGKDFLFSNERKLKSLFAFGLKIKEYCDENYEFCNKLSTNKEKYQIFNISLQFFIINELENTDFKFYEREFGDVFIKNITGKIGDTPEKTYDLLKNKTMLEITGIDFDNPKDITMDVKPVN